MSSFNLVELVKALDTSMGRPPFSDTPSSELLAAVSALRDGLLSSVAAGTLAKDAGAAAELTTTLPVLAAAYPRGSANPSSPHVGVFGTLLDCVVLAFPIITYTLKDLVAQALRSALCHKATAQLLALTKGFNKANVVTLLYGEGVAEEAVKAPTRSPPKPKKGASPPPPWAPPPLAAPPGTIAVLAEAYVEGTLPDDCKPFVMDIFASHGRFADAVGDDDVAAAAILKALMPTIRAAIHPLQLLRVLSPATDSYFVTLAEDRPDYAPILLTTAQSMQGLSSRQAANYRASLQRFVAPSAGGVAASCRHLGEFITAAVLCALVTRTSRLAEGDGFEEQMRAAITGDAVPIAVSAASPTTPLPRPETTAFFPPSDAIAQLLVAGANGYRTYCKESNTALVRCGEALVVLDRHIGRLASPVVYDLPALNDALVRYMDVAMDSTTEPMEVGLSLSVVMHLVDTVVNYKGAAAAMKADAPVPLGKSAIILGANMPLCRAVGMALTMDCSRAVGKHMREFAAVWYGHMLRARSLGIPSILRCASSPLFITPKQSKAHPPSATSTKADKKESTKGGGGKTNKGGASKNALTAGLAAAHDAAVATLTLPPSATAVPAVDGMRVLLFKLLQTSSVAPTPTSGTHYLVRMVLQQLAFLDELEENGGVVGEDRTALLAALCSVPLVSAAQYIVDEVLDAADADTNEASDKKQLMKYLIHHAVFPPSKLVGSGESGGESAEGGGGAGGLAVEEDDKAWMSFLTSLEEARVSSTQSAEEEKRKAAAERLAAVRRAQAEYERQKELIAKEKAEAEALRESKLEQQREIIDMLRSAVAQREKEAADAVARSRVRRALAMRRVQLLEVERRKRDAASQEQATQATKERRELAVSLKEYLIDTLQMEPHRVYPILSFLRTQIDTLSADDVHEYLVTGSLSVPADMSIDTDDDDVAETLNLEEHEVKAKVAKKYLKTHEGLDFWGGTIDFAPANDDQPTDLLTVQTSAPPTELNNGSREEMLDGVRCVMSFHRRVAPILDAFDFSHYEERGTVPSLTRDAVGVVVSKAVLEDRGFCDLSDALTTCSVRGLLTVRQGLVELTPLGAAYHAPFANANKSFQRVFEEKSSQLKRSLEARRAEVEARSAAAEAGGGNNTIFADQWH